MGKSFPGNRVGIAYLMLITAVASWGVNWAVARAVTHEVTPYALVFWRWFLAAAIMLPFSARQIMADLPAARAAWKWMLFFGLAGAVAFPMLGYLGLRYTTAVNASLLNTSMPLFMIPMAWLLRRHTVRKLQIAGLPLSLLGALVIVTAGDLSAVASLRPNPGDLLILAAVVLWALYTIQLDRRPKMHALSFIFYSAVVAILFTAPFYAYDLASGIATPLNLRTASAIGYLAVFPSIVAYLCWNHAAVVVGPTAASFFYPLLPVFGSLAAVLLLGEQIHGYHLAGFVLMLAGLILTSKR
jgi:drug/metabolite transporter (DMT)-like permease